MSTEHRSTHLDSDALSHHIAELRDQGYTYIPGVLPDHQADELAADIAGLECSLATAPENTPFSGARTWRVYNLLARGEQFWTMPLDPLALALADAILGTDCRIYNHCSIAIAPGERAQPIHCDDQVMERVPRPHDATLCVAMWALTDFSADNGATVVYPRSHRVPQVPEFAPEPSNADGIVPVQLEVPKGSLMFWHGSLWHGGGANHSDNRRVAVAVNYCKSFDVIRPEQFRLWDLPRNLVDRFPLRLKELVGAGQEWAPTVVRAQS